MKCGAVVEMRGICSLPQGHGGLHAWVGSAGAALEVPTKWIYVRFVGGGGWDSKVIEFFSRFWTSHVELYFPVGLGSDEPYTFGAQLKGGVGYRTLDHKCYAKVRKWQIWRFPVSPEQEAIGNGLIRSADGSKYDPNAILHFIMGQMDFRSNGHYICSGFLAGYLNGIRAAMILRPIEEYTPQHIFDIVTNLAGAEKFSES